MLKKINQRQWVIGAVMVMALLIGAIYLAVGRHQAKPASKPAQPPALQKAAADLDPLAIAAIRARSYPGSAITAEQNLGAQSPGYSSVVVSYQSDGNKIYALMSTPAGAAPVGGWPVIILDHGYINPATYSTTGPEYRSYIAAFTSAGYVVVKPDYRGHGSSQGVPEGGHFSPVYAYDNLNLVSSLKQYEGFNPKRIGLFGHSLGGHVALRTIVATPDVKATVLMAGVVGSFEDLFYNWPNSPMAGDRPQVVQTTKQSLIAKYGDPKANPTFWNDASAVNYVQYVAGPVQVNQDIGDSTVPKLFSDHLVTAMQQAGKPVEYHLYPGDDHQFSANYQTIIQNVLAFYKANL